MSLSPPVTRQLRHKRQVVCDGYERSDGLWDIEAHLLDTKTFAITPNGSTTVPAGDPIHSMRVRLTIDTTMLIKQIEVSMENTPYHQCSSIEHAFRSIIGERIGSGWRKMIREKVGGVKGCTHVVELLGPIATTAYQSMYQILQRQSGTVPLNGCHVWADNGALVAEYHPQFYRKSIGES